MFPQRRMTTDTPDGNYEQALNLFVRGEDGWVQMPSRSISLNDYMKQLIKAHNADIDTEGTPEEFDMTLCEHLFDGPETIEGLLAEHYTLSWALASLRDKLKHYEDALIPEIMPEGLQTIDRAIGTYGKDAQLTKAVEKCRSSPKPSANSKSASASMIPRLTGRRRKYTRTSRRKLLMFSSCWCSSLQFLTLTSW